MIEKQNSYANFVMLQFFWFSAAYRISVKEFGRDCMYKILLVDDEEMVIKSLIATLNWKEYGFEISGYALSAEEALKKVEELKPEVVITDIKMPKINGLELLQMIKAIYPSTHCIVISGYAEFAYIQKSIRLAAEGYCLKPFDADEIAVYLKRIKNSLDQSNTPVDSANCIADYIQSTTTEALTYMSSFYKDKGIDFEQEAVQIAYVLGVDKLDKTDALISINAGYQKYICFVLEKEVTLFAEQIAATGKKAVHIGISRVVASFEKVARAIREAKVCAYQYFCQEDCNQVNQYTVPHRDKSILQSLERELEYNDCGKIRKYILEISDKFISGDYNIDYAIQLQNIYASWLSNYSKDRESELIYDYEILCERFRNVFDLLFQIESDFNELNQKVTFQNSISNKTFMTIYRYLEKNYLKQINITQLSEEFHINACYFSQLFKKEMGCTFTDYLSNKRIEYACKLLMDTDLKINEISEISGFSDYFYFSRVFRKIKKCSPTEYRAR